VSLARALGVEGIAAAVLVAAGHSREPALARDAGGPATLALPAPTIVSGIWLVQANG
jgi:hypothetical protein